MTGEPDRPGWMVWDPVWETGLRLCKEFWDAPRKQMVVRLLTDDRMQQVWRTLTSNRKTSGWPADPSERARRAAVIFEAACQIHARAYTKDEIEAAQGRCAYVVVQIEKVLHYVRATRGMLLPLALEADDEIRAIESLIVKYRKYIESAGQLPRVTHRRMAEQRGYLITLADAMQQNFGSVMYTTVATIATVVLDEEVTVKRVKQAVAHG